MIRLLGDWDLGCEAVLELSRCIDLDCANSPANCLEFAPTISKSLSCLWKRPVVVEERSNLTSLCLLLRFRASYLTLLYLHLYALSDKSVMGRFHHSFK
jgi:hypothetical protein